MKRIVLVLGALCLVFLAGCPYSSRVPLAEPGPKGLDSRLVGEWNGVDAKGDSIRITVLPFNRSEYYAELQEGSGEASRFRAFGFEVGDARLLHVNEISADKEPQEYSFARYTFPGDAEMALTFLGDTLIPASLATDPRALRSFLREHLEDPAIADEASKLVLHRTE